MELHTIAAGDTGIRKEMLSFIPTVYTSKCFPLSKATPALSSMLPGISSCPPTTQDKQFKNGWINKVFNDVLASIPRHSLMLTGIGLDSL